MYQVIKEKDNVVVYDKNKDMDLWLKELGYTPESFQYLLNPCEQHNPMLLHDMQKAVDMIMAAVANGKSIVIIGDYDCDGETSVSVLLLTLRHLGAHVNYICPHRIINGYGLSKDLVDKAIDDFKADFIITTDNGIAALDACDYAKSKGLELIVTDHHEPKEELPKADAIVHPALGNYPFRDISGCQVAYKLAMELLNQKPKSKFKKASEVQEEKELKTYLFQLATLSIISDVMPVASADEDKAKFNENRKWLIDGLESIHNEPNWRLKLLLENLKINPKVVDEQTIGFYIAPVLNAAGRLGDAGDAVDFLTAINRDQALFQMSFICHLNEERKNIKKEAMKELVINENDKIHILRHPNIHEGIIGILSGQIANSRKEPAIVFTDCEINGEKAWKGSARSNGALNLFEALSDINSRSSCIYTFGGHKDAAGITVLDKNFDEFEKELKAYVDARDIEVNDKVLKISRMQDIENLAKSVKDLKPFGNGLPLPKFKQNVPVNTVKVYNKGGHVAITYYEMNVVNSKKTFNASEFWVFGEAENILNNKEWMDCLDFSSDNSNNLRMNGATEEEIESNKAEIFKRKKDVTLRKNFVFELGYTAFQNTVQKNLNVEWYEK